MELVSAILTTHNREPSYLRRALESVRSQRNCPGMEVIVVDDSDPDYLQRNEVQQLAKAFDGKPFPLRYVQHDHCCGLSAARNTALACSTGEYVAFLDDDDEWLPEKTARQLWALRHCPAAALCYAGGYTEDDSNGARAPLHCVYRRGRVFEALLRGNWIGVPSFVLLRRACVMEIGGFDTALASMEDYDLFLRLAERYDITFVRARLAVYHEHSGGQMTDDAARSLSALEYILDKYREPILKNPAARRANHRKLALAYAENGRRAEALRCWRALCEDTLFRPLYLLRVRWRIERLLREQEM